MSWIDTAIIAAYLLGTTLFGCSFMFRKGGRDADGFMTGGGRLPTWTVALSIFATHVSSIAFLGLPAKAFLTNWNPYVLSITVPVAAVIAAVWFVPFYRNSGCVSAYSLLESRYGLWSRIYASACFLVMQSTRSGFILFLLAILMNTLFGWSVVVIILVTGIATTVYSMLGGISAVVWTDAIQSLILIAGTLLCVIIIGFALPDLTASFSAAFEAGKFSLGSFSLSNWGDETFWVIFVYAMFINLQNFGIDQSFTQRYVAAKSLTAAKRSLMSSAFLYLVNTVFFVLIGTMLWMYVQANPGSVPESVLAKSDAVFPWFIVHKLPVGISGLLVAAIAAAAMSTVSSTLNSGATVLLEDYRKRFSSRKDDERANIAFLRSATVGLGVLSIAIGIGVMNVKSALTAFWAFQSVLSGGMLGLFLLAMLSKRSNGTHAAVSTLVGLFFVAWVTFGQAWTGLSFRLHVNLAIVFGTVALVVTGALLSLVKKRNSYL
jgi:SSS family solute:Na+ symporter